MTPTIHHGDCLEVLRSLPDASIHAVVTDPPYALSFMGRAWDSHDTPIGFQAWCQLWAAECLRVLKPGGHLLAFGGTRTWHRLACAVEDAGFEVRDSIAWMYGSGFPKSLNVSKALDKSAGATREVVGTRRLGGNAAQTTAEKGGTYATNTNSVGVSAIEVPVTASATEEARAWEGWGTALKPAFEPIVVARKPLTGTVAGNVLAHGTGALNIDGCRVEGVKGWPDSKQYANGIAWGDNKGAAFTQDNSQNPAKDLGRWPANVILDEDQANALDQQSGEGKNSARRAGKGAGLGYHGGGTSVGGAGGYDDQGGASRFFYVAKAPKKERPIVDGTAHPTVKPLALMQWLVRLVTPPGGTVLEPFAGSGTTVEACILEGFNVIAIEREADYLPLIQSRIFRAQAAVAVEPEPDLFSELDGEAS